MATVIAHRGRDDSGTVDLTWAGRPFGAFAHRRLSVLDLSPAGRQPMISADGHWVVTFNGEIYNFRALRSELEAAGARFVSDTDTEVLLEGLARHGSSFFRRLRGMFAFAAWNKQHGRGFLVRDAFGIKPLFYVVRPGMLAFASEVRAILASGLVPPEIDEVALRDYLSAGAVAEPRTAIRDVRALPAGSYVELIVTDDRLSAAAPRAFASAIEATTERVSDPHEAAVRVRQALADSVSHHLVSDVPVGIFLSGGLDSSALVALASTTSASRLDTFTVVFDESAYSEAPYAQVVASRFGTRHHEIRLREADFIAALPSALCAMDQPSIDGLNTYVVSNAVHAHDIKVVLSGLGGDELFAGYPSFARAARLAPYWPLVRRTGRALRSILPRGGIRYEKILLLLDAPSAEEGAYRASRALFGRSAIAALTGSVPVETGDVLPGSLSSLQRVSWLETRGYMRDVLLRDADVFGMAHHLEVRVPFVDREVAAAAMSMLDPLKLRNKRGKAVLIDAVKDLLPDQVWKRPKQGFTLPVEAWLRGPLSGLVGGVLRDSGRVTRVGLNAEAAKEVWCAFLQGRLSWSRPWALFTLTQWAERVGAVLTDSSPDDQPMSVAAVSA